MHTSKVWIYLVCYSAFQIYNLKKTSEAAVSVEAHAKTKLGAVFPFPVEQFPHAS